ncbi:Myo-inositol catabolism IolB domain protein [Beutenbergia cavernae DSM 12333]|uniref:Myo-inositol catabolism IolB domain protein n=1 Tax=Beutenbergia cavernae (strain ATCC BAA-8 / DSM 12333 / CCUG 43141 / JCM 11478 / NBRC 16432 / NCIMB 13614 / HKI 0122) TaxID=471853 RepID=C5BYN0_BEUC1|nr:5-deoxy-glucuronate isomerase [Beutenbergia cavernae]ACQ78988.1 Myo-inositol catabolism IolB domain protein [Beutenbergia cavernae DSM 12333]
MTDLHLRAGTAARPGWRTWIDPARAGWAYSGLGVTDPAATDVELRLDADEALVLPLSGAATVHVHDGEMYELVGRRDVFAGPSDALYLPRGTTARLTGHVAVATARVADLDESAGRSGPDHSTDGVAYLPASAVGVELRGAGQASRRVQDYTIDAGPAAGVRTRRLLVCEVVTPGGNWSSYPPHKHDAHAEDERELEEIYAFVVADSPAGEPGLAYHRVYGDSPPIDLLAEVRSGDVVLVPHGYHGPSMAAPGYDLYYLNVMAGPVADGRWLAVDDPTHAWVRRTWGDQEPDPRARLEEEVR